jgi:hypothetical protein
MSPPLHSNSAFVYWPKFGVVGNPVLNIEMEGMMAEKPAELAGVQGVSSVITISSKTNFSVIEKAVAAITVAGDSAMVTLRGPAQMVSSAMNRLKAHHVSAALSIRGGTPVEKG